MMSPLVINRPLSNIHYRKSIIQAFNRIEINSQSGGRLALYRLLKGCPSVEEYICGDGRGGISEVWMPATPSRTWQNPTS